MNPENEPVGEGLVDEAANDREARRLRGWAIFGFFGTLIIAIIQGTLAYNAGETWVIPASVAAAVVGSTAAFLPRRAWVPEGPKKNLALTIPGMAIFLVGMLFFLSGSDAVQAVVMSAGCTLNAAGAFTLRERQQD